MGRRSARRRETAASQTGVELVPDESGGVTIVIDGFPQSYVHPADPGFLPFEYVQHIAAVVDVLPIGKVRATHVGGAGMSLPRYIEFTRPGSAQIVFEPDAALTEQVRTHLPLPAGHRIRVRAFAGEVGIIDLADNSADVVIIDAFAAGRIPASVTTQVFWGQCARVVADSGVVVANVPDSPGLAFVGRVVATARAAGLPHAVLLGTHDVLRGRRFGNIVLAAAAHELDEDELRRRVARAPLPTGLRGQADTTRLTATAAPIRAAGDVNVPTPPDPERWRAV